MSGFRKALEHTINAHSKENGSNTPDFILANFLIGCLDVFDQTVKTRDEWYGHEKTGNLNMSVELGLPPANTGFPAQSSDHPVNIGKTAPDPVAVPDYTSLSEPELLHRLGQDGHQWAIAFCQHAKKLGHDIDEGWAITWFCNAIQHALDVERSALRAELDSGRL